MTHLAEHCATSREVVNSTPDETTGIFHCPNLSCTGVDSGSNRNEYQEYFLVGEGGRCAGLTTVPSSYSECHEICKPQPPGALRACPSLYSDCVIFNSTQIKQKTNQACLFIIIPTA
jgi:hypothetical protein